MLMQDIRVIAKEHGLKTSGIKKQDLIKKIQIAEGNFDCFSTASEGTCDQAGCLWREDCLATSTSMRH